MHQAGGTDDPPTEALGQRLMPQTDAEQWMRSRYSPDQRQAFTGILGTARPRRDDHAVKPRRLEFTPIEPVVQNNIDVGTQLAQVLHEIPGEGVVVIQQEQAQCGAYSTMNRLKIGSSS
jgi:hypothetical protein